MTGLLQDLRYGVRMLWKTRAVTVVAILTLALGIGANTAIFSIVHAVLLRPLPFAESEQLLTVFSRIPRTARQAATTLDLRDWQQQSQSFSSLSAWMAISVNLTGREEPVRVRGGYVSANFFEMLRVQPAMGRGFRTGEDQVGAERVVVLNHSVWRDMYGSDPAILGKSLILDNNPFTVIGVMPAGFQFPLDYAEVWMPYQHYVNYTLDRTNNSVLVFGRLRPGVSSGQAQAEMDTIARNLAQQYPDTNKDRGVALVPMKEILVEDLRPTVLILFAAVGFVLLIACANVASLFLARAATRGKELALRAALGAARGRLLRQILTETGLLWVIGGGLGIFLGWAGVRGLTAISSTQLPVGMEPGLNVNVLAFSLGVTVLTGLLFGLLPAVRASRPDVYESLKEGGRSNSVGASRTRLRSVLVVSQIAMALVLLTGSALVLRSLSRVLNVSPGFDAGNVLTLEYRIARNKYPEPHRQWQFHRDVVERIRALPGVRSATTLLGLPFSGNGGSTGVIIPDRPAPTPGEEPRALTNRVDAYTFETLGIPLLRGRVFSAQDGPDSARVIVVSQTFAERFWHGQDPVGRVIRFPNDPKPATIIGVVGDIKQWQLEEQQLGQIYTHYPQNPHIFATLAVRTTGDPMAMVGAVRQAVWSVDRDQPMWKIRTLESLVERSTGQRRFTAVLLGSFSALALLLAAIGLYGVISYSVSQRTQEVGVRMALGAQRRDIFRLILGQGLLLTCIGIALGAVGAFFATGLIKTLLFQVRERDPLTYVAVAAVLAAVALLATYLPARRATGVDPVIALRYE